MFIKYAMRLIRNDSATRKEAWCAVRGSNPDCWIARHTYYPLGHHAMASLIKRKLYFLADYLSSCTCQPTQRERPDQAKVECESNHGSPIDDLIIMLCDI